MKKILFLVMLLLGIQIGVNAQSGYCPPTQYEPGWISSSSVFQAFPGCSDILGGVNFKYRDISGRTEIIVDWNSMYNTGRYCITDSELKEMLFNGIIADIVRPCNFQGIKQYVFYEETECNVTRKCYLKVSVNREVICSDEGWPGPDPTFYEYQDSKYLVINKDIQCGMQCCEKIYNIECIQGTSGPEYYPHIVNINRSPFPGSECNTEVYFDCLTGEPEICNSKCY